MNEIKFIKILLLKGNFKILGIDYGKKNIGLSIYIYKYKVIIPIKVINFNIEEYIYKIIKYKDIDGIIIGKININNKRISLFEKIKKNTKLPIIYQDERYSSEISIKMLKIFRLKREKRNRICNVVSSKLILDFFLKKYNYIL